MPEEIVQVMTPSEPKPKAEDLMRKIDDLTGPLNGLFEKAANSGLRVEVDVEVKGPKSAPYLLVTMWKEVEPA